MLLIKGAPERISKMCSHTRVNAELRPFDPATVDAANFELGSRGERVLAFAELPLDPAAFPLGFAFDTDKMNFPISNLHFCGLVSLIDPPREGVAQAVLTCLKAGIKVVMVTGDHPVTARAIARSVNIMPGETIEEIALRTGQDVAKVDKESVNAVVVPGHLLSGFTDDDWECDTTNPSHYNQNPSHYNRKPLILARAFVVQRASTPADTRCRGRKSCLRARCRSKSRTLWRICRAWATLLRLQATASTILPRSSRRTLGLQWVSWAATLLRKQPRSLQT
jgi:hypothetical protein